tara:strand:- start:435 stop:1007 length:573 start_codon:yes stop_codon:yes gene_type:complete
MKIKLFKNVIDKEAQEKLKKLLMDQSMFPWYFIKDISGTTPSAKNQGRSGLQHIFCSKGNGVNSNHFNDILPLFNFLNTNEIKILRANAFLQFPYTAYKDYDTPHYDLHTEKDYTILLYYVKSSGGDTIFFNKKNKIIKKVTPTQGTAVLFDGSYLHSAYQSKSDIRCVININIKGKYQNFIDKIVLPKT